MLIEKIVVSEKEKTDDGYKRTVAIHLTHIGEIVIPQKDKGKGVDFRLRLVPLE